MSKPNTAKKDEPVEDRASSRWALAGLSLTILLSSLGTSIANVALPTLAVAFAAPFQQVQWIVLAYLLAITTLIVSVGRLGDIVGRRRLLITGIALFTAASALSGVAPTLWLLIAARAAQGIGAAIMMALAMALVGETVPKEKTGSAMGLLGTMSAIGTALGPSLGGILIAGAGWRTIFLIMVPLGILNILLAHRFLSGQGRSAKIGGDGGQRVFSTWRTSKTIAHSKETAGSARTLGFEKLRQDAPLPRQRPCAETQPYWTRRVRTPSRG